MYITSCHSRYDVFCSLIPTTLSSSMKNKKDGNPLFYLLRKSWEHSNGTRKTIVLYWVLFIIAGTVELLVDPLAFARIITIIQRDNGITSQNISSLIWMLAVMVLSTIVFWALHGPARIIERNNAFKIKVNYRKFLTQGLVTLPLAWHTSNHSGQIIDKTEKGTRSLFEFSENVFEIIYSLVRLLGSCIVLAYFFPISVCITLSMFVLTCVVITRFDKTLMMHRKKLNWMENGITQTLVDIIGNMTTVIILRVEQLVFKSIVQKTEEPFPLFKKNNSLNEIKWFLTNVFCILTVSIVLGIYFNGHTGILASILLSELYLLYQYLQNISGLFSRFASMYGRLMVQQAQVLNAEEITQEFITASFTTHVLPKQWNVLKIRELTFSYKGNNISQLQDVGVDILHGQKIAVIGQTGGGKTTFLKLIRDLYTPQKVCLHVDDQHIPDGFVGIARGIALMPQKPEIFANTIHENLTFGVSYDEKLIKEALQISCFQEVVEGLEHGLDTKLGEDGLTLSGGQQQRLALARGLLACEGKDLVLFDEPTSSLDARTERSVYRAIIEKFTDKTMICSTHNLRLLDLFDVIFVFDKGKLVSSGTIEELHQKCSVFQSLYGCDAQLVS